MLPSASLVPASDEATLLFTNAGMVPFKKIFLGDESPLAPRVTTSQRCVRAGGKHNDLDNVGYTARHHTFFEMLGNFSFGDYFKREAIGYAWEFLTQVLALPEEKLWITVFEEDDEAADIWLSEVGVSPERFSRCGAKDNFWQMGETGPCGPCSEVFYDHGPEIPGGPPGTPEADLDRYIEIWNLVFMQYDRDAEGRLTLLPKPSVDTGMGLERICAVLQGVHDNYDIDLFQNLLKALSDLCGESTPSNQSMRVIVDHIRSTAFLILDGVYPSNEGRGYVLRRIIRRAVRHGHQLGLTAPFLHRLLPALVAADPALSKHQDRIAKALQQEEEQFNRTLEQGLGILEAALLTLEGTEIPGTLAFKLYDTYGFPLDLTQDIARERGLTLDEKGFDHEMARQRARSSSSSQFKAASNEIPSIDAVSEFVGYDAHIADSFVLAVIRCDDQSKMLTEALSEGETGILIVASTPFYAESGGQVGDIGEIRMGSNCFTVTDTQKQNQAILHDGYLKSGTIKVGDCVELILKLGNRQAIRCHHSATHLLHAALRNVLGDHILQKGSLVNATHLRFDFSHPEALTETQCRTVEALVNQEIRENHRVVTEVMSKEKALSEGALAFFEDKYAEKVRVLTMGGFSKELCGGTHVKQTGDLGFFKIISESAIAAGIRRIEAVAAQAAEASIFTVQDQLSELKKLLRSDAEHLFEKTNQLLIDNKKLSKEIQKLKEQCALASSKALMTQAQRCGDIDVLALKLDDVEPTALKTIVMALRTVSRRAVMVLAVVHAQRVHLMAGVTDDLTERYSAHELVNYVASQVQGKGGGRREMAQAGGRQPEYLEKALNTVEEWLKKSKN